MGSAPRGGHSPRECPAAPRIPSPGPALLERAGWSRGSPGRGRERLRGWNEGRLKPSACPPAWHALPFRWYLAFGVILWLGEI